jgi:hypothetical protein
VVLLMENPRITDWMDAALCLRTLHQNERQDQR